MVQFIISQVLGGIALILVCISYFCNKKVFLIFQTVANVFYGSAFIVSLSLVAGINTFISMTRTALFYFYERKKKQIPYCYILIYSAIYITIGVIFFKSPWDILTIISPILFTTAMAMRKMITVNFMLIIPNIMLVIYNIFNTFYTSAILDTIEVAVIVVSIITYFVIKKKTQNPPPEQINSENWYWVN